MDTSSKERVAEKLFIEASNLEEMGDIEQAIRLYRTAAKYGNTYAQTNLGNLLDDKITPSKPKEAIYWYKRAVRAGDEIAAFALAVHYKNLDQRRWYLYWLQRAAEMGEQEAINELKMLQAINESGISESAMQSRVC